MVVSGRDVYLVSLYLRHLAISGRYPNRVGGRDSGSAVSASSDIMSIGVSFMGRGAVAGIRPVERDSLAVPSAASLDLGGRRMGVGMGAGASRGITCLCE